MSNSPLPDPVRQAGPRWVRLLLLVPLPLLLVALYWQGQSHDPALDQLVLQRAGAGKGGGGPAVRLPEQLQTLVRSGPVRQYGKDRLFEYINGHAEFFISAGFRELTVVDYATTAAAATPALVVDLYDMEQPLHAFGVLVDEMPSGAAQVEVGTMGWQTGQAVGFTQGPFYVRMAGFAPELPLVTMAQQVAQAMQQGEGANKGAGASSPLAVFPALPGRVETTRFVKENYRGLAFFTRVLEQTLTGLPGAEPVRVFHPLGASAGPLEEQLRAFLTTEGVPFQVTAEANGARIWRVDDPYEGQWWLVCRPDGRIFGLLGVDLEQEPWQPLRRRMVQDGNG